LDYRKITTVLVVADDDVDAVMEQLNGALDKLENLHTVYDSGIQVEATGEPENAKEIGAPIPSSALSSSAP